MPSAKTVTTAAKLVPSAAESSIPTRANRARLSKVLAARPAQKPAENATPAIQPKSNGARQKKLKLVSNRCKMPAIEYVRLTALKKRLLALGIAVKKSQLLRAGVLLLADLDDIQLQKTVAKVEFAKSGRSATKAS